jgi:hypothetical protein
MRNHTCVRTSPFLIFFPTTRRAYSLLIPFLSSFASFFHCLRPTYPLPSRPVTPVVTQGPYFHDRGHPIRQNMAEDQLGLPFVRFFLCLFRRFNADLAPPLPVRRRWSHRCQQLRANGRNLGRHRVVDFPSYISSFSPSLSPPQTPHRLSRFTGLVSRHTRLAGISVSPHNAAYHSD